MLSLVSLAPRSARRRAGLFLGGLAGCLLVLLLSSRCKDDTGLPLPLQNHETGQAKDYMPFASGRNVVRWEANKTIRIMLAGGAKEEEEDEPPRELPEGDEVVGKPVEGWIFEMNEAFVVGASTWNAALATIRVEIDWVDNGEPNDVTVGWTNDGSRLGGGTVLGVAAFRGEEHNPSRYILMSALYDLGINDEHTRRNTIIAVAAHEMGHMLGLWSHSTGHEDIMFPRIDTQATPVLSSRDQLTLVRAYQQPADVDLSLWPANTEAIANSIAAQAQAHDVLPSASWEIRFTLHLTPAGTLDAAEPQVRFYR